MGRHGSPGNMMRFDRAERSRVTRAHEHGQPALQGGFFTAFWCGFSAQPYGGPGPRPPREPFVPPPSVPPAPPFWASPYCTSEKIALGLLGLVCALLGALSLVAIVLVIRAMLIL